MEKAHGIDNKLSVCLFEGLGTMIVTLTFLQMWTLDNTNALNTIGWYPILIASLGFYVMY